MCSLWRLSFALVHWVDNDHTVYFGCFAFGTPLIVPAMLISSANPVLGVQSQTNSPVTDLRKRATTQKRERAEGARQTAWERRAACLVVCILLSNIESL